MLPPKPPPFSWPPSCSYRLIGKKVFPPQPPTRPEPKRCDESGARILFPLDNRSRLRRGDQDAAARPPLARLPPAQAVLYLRRFPLNVPTYAGSRGHGELEGDVFQGPDGVRASVVLAFASERRGERLHYLIPQRPIGLPFPYGVAL